MAIGVNLSIDVTKLNKDRFFTGKKGTYANLTVFINDEADQYGQHGGIFEKLNEDESDKNFVGNAKVFWSDQGTAQAKPLNAVPESSTNIDDALPF